MDKVLIHCVDRYVKGILLRLTVQAGLDVAEAADAEDVRLKLSLFGDAIVLYVVEVTRQNRERMYQEVQQLRDARARWKGAMVALVPDESADMVGGALRAGIGDVILLPQKRERYREVLSERFADLVEKGRAVKGRPAAPEPVPTPEPVPESPAAEVEDPGAALLRELKMASRGGHTVSLLMVRTTGLSAAEGDALRKALIQDLRDTDRVLPHAPETFLVVCPFTQKTFIVEVERKVRDTYARLYGDFTMDRRIYLFGANYPSEERDVETLLARMENGIHDSMAFTALRTPLHTLSPVEMERFRKKLRLYRL